VVSAGAELVPAAVDALVVVSYRDCEIGLGHPLAVMLGDTSNHASLTATGGNSF
jgi:hypothetical protein